MTNTKHSEPHAGGIEAAQLLNDLRDVYGVEHRDDPADAKALFIIRAALQSAARVDGSLQKRPVAFRVKTKDYGESWMLCRTEEVANHEAEEMGGALVQGLYVRDGSAIATPDARAAALEEAAKVAEDVCAAYEKQAEDLYKQPGEGRACSAANAAEQIASRIRALSPLPAAVTAVDTTGYRANLVMRMDAYLEDRPMDGRHSDAAGSNALELIEEARNELSAAPSAPADGWRTMESAQEDCGWLIETASGEYWNGKNVGNNCRDAFVHDPNEAIRFARHQDAEVVRCWLFGQPGTGIGWSLRTAQHKWISGHAQRALPPPPNKGEG